MDNGAANNNQENNRPEVTYSCGGIILIQSIVSSHWKDVEKTTILDLVNRLDAMLVDIEFYTKNELLEVIDCVLIAF